MKILVTGADGLVGSRVVELLNTKYDFVTPEYPEFDLTNSDSIKFISSLCPQVVIHFAAYTNVSDAEKQKDLCWQINVDGTQNLLAAIDTSKTHFIYISTDMVFPGTNGPYREIDPVADKSEQITWYAWTKLQAEKLLDTNKSSIVRIIYPVRAKYIRKLDYLRGPLKKFDDQKLHPFFSDQQVSITLIDEITVALEKIIENKSTGIFHVSSPDTGTPHEIISYLFQTARNYKGELARSSVKDFPSTRYPHQGGLDPKNTEEKLGIKFSPWRQIIDQLVAQRLSTA